MNLTTTLRLLGFSGKLRGFVVALLHTRVPRSSQTCPFPPPCRHEMPFGPLTFPAKAPDLFSGTRQWWRDVPSCRTARRGPGEQRVRLPHTFPSLSMATPLEPHGRISEVTSPIADYSIRIAPAVDRPERSASGAVLRRPPGTPATNPTTIFAGTISRKADYRIAALL